MEGIVSQRGGSIRIESRVGSGTSVSILLPLTGEPADRPAPPARAEARRSARRLLLVEDEDLVRAVLTRTLREAGYEVLPARNGREALDLLNRGERPIDLVITDLSCR